MLHPARWFAISFLTIFPLTASGGAPVYGQTPLVPRTDLNLPEVDLAVPAWLEKHGQPPFPVARFLEDRARISTDGNRLYRMGLAEFTPELSKIFPKAEQANREVQSKALNELIYSVRDTENPSVEKLSEVVVATKRSRELFDAAQSHSHAGFRAELSMTPDVSHIQGVRTASTLATHEIRLSHGTGTFADAHRILSRGLRLTRDLRRAGTSIPLLAAVARDALLFESLDKFILTRPDLTVADCDRLLVLLREHEAAVADQLSESVRADYLTFGNFLDALQTGRTDDTKFMQPFTPEVIKKVPFDKEWTELNRLYALVWKYCQRPYHDALVNNDVQFLYPPSRQPKLLSGSDLVAALLEGRLVVEAFADYSMMRAAVARNETRTRAYQAVTLVRRFKIRHGKWPESMEAAVKDAGLESELIDPNSGKPLRFRFLKGNPLVYSVGTDQLDDGGEKEEKWGIPPGDFLFPVP